MPSFLLAIIASAGLGAVIGLIRQWSEQAEQDSERGFAGLRTFTIWSVLGCVAAYLSDHQSPAVLPVVLGAVALHYSLLGRGPGRDHAGITTFAATLLTLIIGALVHWGQPEAAVLLGGLTMVLLGVKQPVHAWTRAFTGADIRATLQFAAISGVILPLVPNRDLGPYGGFNPHSIWMMVVLISGVGFAGYVCMRLLGARAGVALTSFFGGIASSTATTLAFSRRSREDPTHAGRYAMAVAIASTVMLGRILVILVAVSSALALRLVAPFAAMALPGALCVGVLWWRDRGRRHDAGGATVANPLSLSIALKFAAFFAVVSFVVKALTHAGHLQGSVLAFGFLAGLGDLDAISLSLGRQFGGQADTLDLAARAIVLAAIANSFTKGALAAAFGTRELRRPVVITLGAVVGIGLAGVFLMGRGR